jgi:hypothetical protein
MVREKGFEPLWPCGRQLLRLVRLPVPPLPQRRAAITLTIPKCLVLALLRDEIIADASGAWRCGGKQHSQERLRYWKRGAGLTGQCGA